MNRERALAILKLNRDELQRQGVARAALFGSTSRGEERASSDVDILIELDPAASLGVYEYVAIRRFLAELFPGPVDVVNRATLKAHVRPSAERDAVYAF